VPVIAWFFTGVALNVLTSRNCGADIVGDVCVCENRRDVTNKKLETKSILFIIHVYG